MNDSRPPPELTPRAFASGMLLAGLTGFLIWMATDTFVFFPAFLGMGVVLGMVFSQAAARRHH